MQNPNQIHKYSKPQHIPQIPILRTFYMYWIRNIFFMNLEMNIDLLP